MHGEYCRNCKGVTYIGISLVDEFRANDSYRVYQFESQNGQLRHLYKLGVWKTAES